MVQVVTNIVENAVKYSPTSRQLTVTGAQKGRYVELLFSDRRIGIPADDLPHVREQFYRGRNATGGGSGLGLAIAHRILRYHHGEMSIVSQVNVGTKIGIVLPIASEL